MNSIYTSFSKSKRIGFAALLLSAGLFSTTAFATGPSYGFSSEGMDSLGGMSEFKEDYPVYADFWVGSPVSSQVGNYTVTGKQLRDDFGGSYDALCNQAAANAGLATSNQYWCTIYVDGLNPPQCFTWEGTGGCAGTYDLEFAQYTAASNYPYTWNNGGRLMFSAVATILNTKPSDSFGDYNNRRLPSGYAGCEVYITNQQSGETDQVGDGCALAKSASPIPTAPTATLGATPSSIVTGNSSILSWSSTDATSCTGTGFLTQGAISGSATVSPTATTDYSVTCIGDGGSDTATKSVTVTAVPTFPDLTASAISPPSAVAGTPVNLSATITNSGTDTTGIGFTNLFQRATDANGSNAIDIGTDSNGALAIGGSAPASLLYTFPTNNGTGYTTYIRACADKTSAGDAGVITESDENNNCSPSWTAVTVSDTPLPTIPTCSLSAAGPSVPTNLIWSSTNATSCTGGGFGFNTGNATSGTAPVTNAGLYTLQCNGAGGICNASVNVGGGACTAPTGTLTASPSRIKSGASSILTYSASGITGSCILTGPNGAVLASVPANTCNVPTGTASTGALTTQAVYILTCDGTERARTVVNVLPIIIEF